MVFSASIRVQHMSHALTGDRQTATVNILRIMSFCCQFPYKIQ